MAAPKAPDSRLADYDLKYIDKGAYGAVYRAVRKKDGREFALKQVDLSNMKRMELAMARDEAVLLSQLNHPHVIRYYDSFIDKDNRLNILMEYASKGSVKTLISSYRGRPMPEDVIWRVAVQALLGLQYLHSKKIIHRDIKSANLFIDSRDVIKIGDLGIARTLSASSQLAHTQLGTPYYLAPELCEDKPYNAKSDIWSLGVILYECTMGTYPFDVQNGNTAALIRKIIKGVFKPVQGPYSPALIQLVTSCLTFRPESRPDAAQLLRNPGLVAKAKALNIDLNPRPAAEDPAPPAQLAAQLAAAQQQQQQQQSAAPPAVPLPAWAELPAGAGPGGGVPPGHPFAGAGSPGPNPYQQQQSPYQQQRPSGGYGAGRSPQPAGHPFALAGQGQGPAGYGSPQPYQPQGGYASPQQQVYNYQAGYASPPQQQGQQGPNSPGAMGGGGYGQQQQRGAGGSPYVVQPPYGGGGPPVGWDQLAADVNRMQLHGSEVARMNAERQQAAQANMHAGKQDHAKDVIYGGAQDSGPRAQRVPPEALPAAGKRPTSAHAGAPFATHYAAGGVQTQAHASMNEAWTASYQPPQYGRRRNPDLQITGPSLRGSGPGGGARGGRAGFVPAADDATTYVSSTSYYTGYK